MTYEELKAAYEAAVQKCSVTANQTSGQKNEPRSTTAQIPYSVHHNELL